MAYPYGGRPNFLETEMDRYYFYNDQTKIIYHSKEFSLDPDLIYLGSSDNPNFAMAAQVLTKNNTIPTGYRLRRLD
jgi:hypothetical protein